MSDTEQANGWPDIESPGVPRNPSVSGQHWVTDSFGRNPTVWDWNGPKQCWDLARLDFSPSCLGSRGFRYCGPCIYTPPGQPRAVDEATARKIWDEAWKGAENWAILGDPSLIRGDEASEQAWQSSEARKSVGSDRGLRKRVEAIRDEIDDWLSNLSPNGILGVFHASAKDTRDKLQAALDATQ